MSNTEVGTSAAVRGSAVPSLNDLALTGYTISRPIPVHCTVIYELVRETP